MEIVGIQDGVRLPFFWNARPQTRTRFDKAARVRPFLVPEVENQLVLSAETSPLLARVPSDRNSHKAGEGTSCKQLAPDQVSQLGPSSDAQMPNLSKRPFVFPKTCTTDIYQSLETDLPHIHRIESLPSLPRVPLAQSKVARLNKLLRSWRAKQPAPFRVGNIVKVQAGFSIGPKSIRAGTRGIVHEVNDGGSCVVQFENDIVSIKLSKRQSSSLEVQVLTHKVELIDHLGRCAKECLHCAVELDHGDGFIDITCQDGRKACNINEAFLRQLPVSKYSDSIEVRDANSVETPGPGFAYLLPPAGFLKAVKGKAKLEESRLDFLSTGAGESSNQESGQLQDACHFEVSGNTAGPNLCPFIEIQEGGLNSFASLCVLAAEDKVFDLGCGTGKILDKILQAFPCRGVGVEINPSLARKAEQQLSRYRDRARVIVSDVRNIDLADATVVTSYFLSHSFISDGSSLREHLSRNLQSGCVVLNYTYEIPGWIGIHSNGIHKYVIGHHLPEP